MDRLSADAVARVTPDELRGLIVELLDSGAAWDAVQAGTWREVTRAVALTFSAEHYIAYREAEGARGGVSDLGEGWDAFCRVVEEGPGSREERLHARTRVIEALTQAMYAADADDRAGIEPRGILIAMHLHRPAMSYERPDIDPWPSALIRLIAGARRGVIEDFWESDEDNNIAAAIADDVTNRADIELALACVARQSRVDGIVDTCLEFCTALRERRDPRICRDARIAVAEITRGGNDPETVHLVRQVDTAAITVALSVPCGPGDPATIDDAIRSFTDPPMPLYDRPFVISERLRLNQDVLVAAWSHGVRIVANTLPGSARLEAMRAEQVERVARAEHHLDARYEGPGADRPPQLVPRDLAGIVAAYIGVPRDYLPR